jgi:hypothetical protein
MSIFCDFHGMGAGRLSITACPCLHSLRVQRIRTDTRPTSGPGPSGGRGCRSKIGCRDRAGRGIDDKYRAGRPGDILIARVTGDKCQLTHVPSFGFLRFATQSRPRNARLNRDHGRITPLRIRPLRLSFPSCGGHSTLASVRGRCQSRCQDSNLRVLRRAALCRTVRKCSSRAGTNNCGRRSPSVVLTASTYSSAESHPCMITSKCG